MFLLLSETCKHKYNDRYHIRQCLKHLLHASSQSRDIKIQNIKCSEKECTPDRIQRFPQCKDYQRNSQPSAVTESIVCPCSTRIFHDKIKSTKTGKTGADTRRQIFIFDNIDTCCIRSSRIFPNCTKIQSALVLNKKKDSTTAAITQRYVIKP